MKSRISYFNPAVVGKNITRFAPLWGLYLIFGILIVFLFQLDSRSPAQLAAELSYIGFAPMTVVNFCYAPLCALLLFGDLFKARMCYSLHAMPLRREGWFLTNVVSGFLFSFVPNVLVALFMMLFCGSFWYIPLSWVGAMALQFTCFFGIAVLSVHLAGSALGTLTLYLLVNYLSLLIYGIIVTVYTEPLLYGVVLQMEAFLMFMPASQLMTMGIEPNYDNLTQTLSPEWCGWGSGCVWAAVGLAMLVLALLLYRRRHMETAGDFISFRPIAPVVLVLYTMLVGLILFAMFRDYAALLVGIAIGFFTGRMLLERTVRVFRKKNWLGWLAVTVCVILSVVLTLVDPIGIVSWVPEADKVESVSLGSYNGGIDYEYSHGKRTFTDPEDIGQLLQVHENALELHEAYEQITTRDSVPEEDYSPTVGFMLTYQMNSGTVRQRQYFIPVDSAGGEILCSIKSRPEYIFGEKITDGRMLLACTRYVSVSGYERIPQDKLAGLVEALEKDWQAGDLAQNWSFHEDSDYLLSLSINLVVSDAEEYYVDLTVYSDCVNTVEWLKANGYEIHMDDKYDY